MTPRIRPALPFLAALAAACAPAAPPPAVEPVPSATAAAPQPAPEPAAQPVPRPAPAPERAHPVAPPLVAYRLGLMPLASSGADAFRAVHPTSDGRGILVAILDSGVDPAVLGLQSTTTGAPKLLDLRNFSGEGDVALEPVSADTAGRIALPGGLVVSGAATVRAAAVSPHLFGGVLRELPFGDVPAADLDGNGDNRGRFGVVVVRGPSGWLAFVDTNGDGTLADETAVADFLARREWFTFRSGTIARGRGPVAVAVNLGDDPTHPDRPRLSFVMDTAGHGTHVAGIAAGHDLYGVPGFDGLAPGAQLLGLKIADDARGGVSTDGSMIRAMEYAARFAEQRHLPLVLNMSFGIGNEVEGTAAMDSLVDAFLLRHPDVVFAISAGNDGPGLSTMGLPASAELALTVGAVYPASFARAQFGSEGGDVLGWWTSRGAQLSKPDVVTPGIAYSTVPAWNTGEEIKLGTSMAAPYATGVVTLLESALAQAQRPIRAAQVIQALRATSRRLAGETPIDEGYGEPQLEAAWRWLQESHAAPRLEVRAVTPGPTPPPGVLRGPVAATARGPARTAGYRRDGLASPGDTVQRFIVGTLPGDSVPAGAFRLVADQPWVRPAAPTATLDRNGSATVEVRYDAAALARPGRYVGTVYGIPLADSAAGPAFALVNTVVVPDTASRITVVARKVGTSGAARYFLRVPPGASGLAARVAVRDSTVPSWLYLFEPDGRPSRAQDRVGVGAEGSAHGEASVSANDLVPGVWEFDVQAAPAKPLTYDLDVAVPSLRLTVADSATGGARVTLATAGGVDTTAVVAAEQLGVTRLRELTLVNGALLRDTVEAPAWAKKVVTEVQVPPEAWGQLTDLSITVYDAEGAQLGQGAMNYPFHRVAATLPERRGTPYRVQVEVFPAFAHDTAPARFPVRVRETFVGDPRPLQVAGAQGPPSDSLQLAVPARGAVRATLGGLVDALLLPGWDAWVRVVARGRQGGWPGVERFIAVRRGP